jgi:hypothetical protein
MLYCQITGGRNFADKSFVWGLLDRLYAKTPFTIQEGGAKGADRLAQLWAKERGYPFLTVMAEWDRLGNAAGLVRNSAMLDKLLVFREEGHTIIGVAFPGGKGTKDMVAKMLNSEIRVLVVGPLAKSEWEGLTHVVRVPYGGKS